MDDCYGKNRLNFWVDLSSQNFTHFFYSHCPDLPDGTTILRLAELMHSSELHSLYGYSVSGFALHVIEI